MKKGFWSKRIPTLLGLIILLVGTIFTTFLANKKQIIQVNAVNSDQPQNVRISNITDSSFTVSYTTDIDVTGSINYGSDENLGQSALDDRDQTKGSTNNYKVHTITAKNLQPSSKYFFTITSGKQIYTTDGKDFEVTTGPTLQGQSTQITTIKGDIITAEGTIPDEAIIYLTAENSQVISFTTDQSGHYEFLLSSVRTSDLKNFYNFVDNQSIKMLVVGKKESSNVILSIPSETVPTITLSKDYDFTYNANNATPSANLEETITPSPTPAEEDTKPEIISPQKGEGFSDQQPVFNGTALPDQDVQIEIHSNEKIQTVVTADSQGNWSYQPSTPLSAGNHTITITTRNSSGILETITQSFVVYAATESVTPIPENSLSATPTIDVSTQTSTISATPTQTLPASGNATIITIGIVGLIISLVGGLLFLLTRGGV